jgi:DNA-binding NarL/FixJ family response regulator
MVARCADETFFLSYNMTRKDALMRVLLADQHPDIRLALAILLNKEPGAIIVGSVSEAEGLLALAKTSQPDIVILDSDLPGRPTEEVLTSLRRLDQHPKVLLLSNSPTSLLQTYQANIDAIISKNDPPEILREKFRALFAT